MAGSAVTPAPCSFFAAGKCRNGANCTFSHAATATQPSDRIRLPCKFFLQNACTAGRECKFLHDVSAKRSAQLLTTTSAGERKPAPGSFGTRCKFFDSGSCTAGSRCPYRHAERESGQQSGSEHSGTRASTPLPPPPRKPVAMSTVKMHMLTPSSRNQSNATAEGTQTEGEATQQELTAEDQEEYYGEQEDGEEEDEEDQEGGVAKLSDFLTKEEELYYYGAPGEFDEMMQDGAEYQYQLEGKPSYADIARQNADEEDADDAAAYAYAADPGVPPKTCTFFLQGNCRYGASCFYAHSLEKVPSTADEHALVQQELHASADLECGICYDLILVKGERFGLLSGCSHPFCLPCVRNWRGNGDQPKQTVRQCPVCRVETHFVIPSNRMITDVDRKKKLMTEYTRNLASIPCRHFDEGRGTCPFGTSCFYAHRFPTGEEEVRQVRTAVDSEGQYDVLRNMRLDHFFQNLEIS